MGVVQNNQHIATDKWWSLAPKSMVNCKLYIDFMKKKKVIKMKKTKKEMITLLPVNNNVVF